MAFEARLPPLQPKVSAKLCLLAAANGCLFAGPAVNGGLLQWGRPEGNMRRPLDVEGEHTKRVGGVGVGGMVVGAFAVGKGGFAMLLAGCAALHLRQQKGST